MKTLYTKTLYSLFAAFAVSTTPCLAQPAPTPAPGDHLYTIQDNLDTNSAFGNASVVVGSSPRYQIIGAEAADTLYRFPLEDTFTAGTIALQTSETTVTKELATNCQGAGNEIVALTDNIIAVGCSASGQGSVIINRHDRIGSTFFTPTSGLRLELSHLAPLLNSLHNTSLQGSSAGFGSEMEVFEDNGKTYLAISAPFAETTVSAGGLVAIYELTNTTPFISLVARDIILNPTMIDGDEFGFSIKAADLNGNGQTDLFISAPGARAFGSSTQSNAGILYRANNNSGDFSLQTNQSLLAWNFASNAPAPRRDDRFGESIDLIVLPVANNQEERLLAVGTPGRDGAYVFRFNPTLDPLRQYVPHDLFRGGFTGTAAGSSVSFRRAIPSDPTEFQSVDLLLGLPNHNAQPGEQPFGGIASILLAVQTTNGTMFLQNEASNRLTFFEEAVDDNRRGLGNAVKAEYDYDGDGAEDITFAGNKGGTPANRDNYLEIVKGPENYDTPEAAAMPIGSGCKYIPTDLPASEAARFDSITLEKHPLPVVEYPRVGRPFAVRVKAHANVQVTQASDHPWHGAEVLWRVGPRTIQNNQETPEGLDPSLCPTHIGGNWGGTWYSSILTDLDSTGTILEGDLLLTQNIGSQFAGAEYTVEVIIRKPTSSSQPFSNAIGRSNMLRVAVGCQNGVDCS